LLDISVECLDRSIGRNALSHGKELTSAAAAWRGYRLQEVDINTRCLSWIKENPT